MALLDGYFTVKMQKFNNFCPMNLFDIAPDPSHNLLPGDGRVNYYGRVLEWSAANRYFEALMSGIAWQNDEAYIFGKHFVTKRKVAWYADAAFPYSYSNATKKALPWTTELQELKRVVEDRCGDHFNACLLNLYHDGTEGMAFHSDNEKALGRHAAIASVSFGAARQFSFKHKRTGEKVSLVLEHGSLLLMRDETQENWLHRLDKSKKITQPRINLTFRTMV
jgi:alkylated DNA repair dioxygenase AlkB